MNYDDPELLDRLAGEYVFGSLSSRARRRFERLRRELPAAEKAALEWERRLMPLSGSVPAERPPARVWSAIDARTGGRARRPAAAAWSWRRPAMGFAFGILATIGVIGLFPPATLIESMAQQRGTLPQSYAGLLTDAQDNVVLVASSLRYGRMLSVKWLRPMAPTSGRVAVLWALPREGVPFAVGVVPTTPDGERHARGYVRQALLQCGSSGGVVRDRRACSWCDAVAVRVDGALRQALVAPLSGSPLSPIAVPLRISV